MNPKTAAAYLLSIFVWRLGQILGALYLDGSTPLAITAFCLLVDLQASGDGRSRDIRFHYHFDPGAETEAADRGGAALIVDLHRDLIDELHRRTCLSKSALWRLVTDGIAEGFLDHGRRTGQELRAQQEAIALLAEPPLQNPQWQFIEINVEGKRRRWFRLRGGCCRLYLTPGTDY